MNYATLKKWCKLEISRVLSLNQENDLKGVVVSSIDVFGRLSQSLKWIVNVLSVRMSKKKMDVQFILVSPK